MKPERSKVQGAEGQPRKLFEEGPHSVAQPRTSPGMWPAWMAIEPNKALGLQCLRKLASSPASLLAENFPTLRTLAGAGPIANRFNCQCQRKASFGYRPSASKRLMDAGFSWQSASGNYSLEWAVEGRKGACLYCCLVLLGPALP